MLGVHRSGCSFQTCKQQTPLPCRLGGSFTWLTHFSEQFCTLVPAASGGAEGAHTPRGCAEGCSRHSSPEWMCAESSSLKADFGSWDDITIYNQARSLLQA